MTKLLKLNTSVFLFTTSLFCYFAAAVAFQINFYTHPLSHRHKEIQLSLSKLPSAYDASLPAQLVGEAVRSALKSDRGTCLDFTSPVTQDLNVGVVKVTGETAKFLNSKFSNSFPEKVNSKVTNIGPNIQIKSGQVKEAGLVTSKGRLIDKLTVLSFDGEESIGLGAFLVTSPGHYGSMLFDRLDPFIFPLDGVKLQDMCPTAPKKSSGCNRLFTVLATKIENVQSSIQQNVSPILAQWGFDIPLSFPKDKSECLHYSATNANGEKIELLLYEQTFLTSCCCRGYSLVISADENTDIGSKIWSNMVDANNFDGPVELGPQEYETLRIEAGVPAFGHEITGGLSNDEDRKGPKKANASPLELHLDHIVDETKGCYQGQEAIAAQLNNKRGVPRTLYSVIFPEEDNFFNDQPDEEEYSNHGNRLSNKTNKPEAGADLYVLGSNQNIKVGTLTSVAEKDGTSLSETVTLALVRRSESIIKKMNAMGLEIDMRDDMFGEDPFWSDENSVLLEENGIINPPPLDPLDGLEVVLSESFTQGYLRPIPIRRLKGGENIFETDSWSTSENSQEETGSVMGFIPQDDPPLEAESSSESNLREEKEMSEMQIISEAERKKEKMELLKQRAEEAMKKRRQKKEEEMKVDSKNSFDENATLAAAEEGRKEEKMKLLKERAEAAMKRRREKKDT